MTKFTVFLLLTSTVLFTQFVSINGLFCEQLASYGGRTALPVTDLDNKECTEDEHNYCFAGQIYYNKNGEYF